MNSPLPSSSTFLFYKERCIKENTSASPLWFPTKSCLSIAPHHIPSRRRRGRRVLRVYGAGGNLDISLLSNVQTSSAATLASYIKWYRISFRVVKRPERQADPSLSPTRLYGVDRENFSLYRETNGVNGHKLTGL
jgi:hypothetical protein